MPPVPLFGETADPESYVARPACERVLAAIGSALAESGRAALLVGPPGLGKTLLLRVLALRARASGPTLVHLPYAALEFGDLCAWVLGLLGAPRAADPVAALERAAAGAPLGLLIDDANSMPLATARALGDRLREPGAGLRVVLAAPDDARTSRVAAALALDPVECRLDLPLREQETRELLHERLRRAGAEPVVWRRFSPEIVARLHGLSAGNPRRLLALAAEIALGATPECALASAAPGWS